eukprot:GHVP01043854.1.p1 GENE.GHVP01043854.1~~GHVP01043854.1.p1  ORF type:complete len:320 (+),score=54.29 GHVP01043854.1:6-965(+)
MQEILFLSTDTEFISLDIKTGQRISTLKEEIGEFRFIPSNNGCPSQNNIVAISSQGNSLVFLTPKYRKRIFKSTSKITSVTVSMDLIFLGLETGKIAIYERNTGKKLLTVAAHTGSVTKLVLTTDEEILLSGGDDGVIISWDVNSFKDGDQKDCSIKKYYAHNNKITDIHIGVGRASSFHFVASSIEGKCSITPVYKQEDQKVVDFRSEITSITMDSLERFVAVGYSSGKISVFQTEGSGVCPFILEYHSDKITSLYFTIDNSLLVSTSLDGKVVVWTYQEQEKINTFSIEAPISFSSLLIDQNSYFCSSENIPEMYLE